MGEMRRIPVVASGRGTIGWLLLGEAVTDEEVINSYVSWGVRTSDRRLFEAALVPRLAVQGAPDEGPSPARKESRPRGAGERT